MICRVNQSHVAVPQTSNALTKSGMLLVSSQRHRSQKQNYEVSTTCLRYMTLHCTTHLWAKDALRKLCDRLIVAVRTLLPPRALTPLILRPYPCTLDASLTQREIKAEEPGETSPEKRARVAVLEDKVRGARRCRLQALKTDTALLQGEAAAKRPED